MSHTAEEKIKILYEDSLRDVRDLTNRMESMTATLVAATETVTSGKNILFRQNEQLLNDINEIKKAAGKIASQNGAKKEDVSAAVHEILLGETGPMKELRAISTRFFSTEAQATKWLMLATNKMNRFTWHLISSALAAGITGGVAGGIVMKLFSS